MLLLGSHKNRRNKKETFDIALERKAEIMFRIQPFLAPPPLDKVHPV
jgi:hypothetical protein